MYPSSPVTPGPDPRVTEVLAHHPAATPDRLIALLQEIQAACGYLSPAAVEALADHLGVPASRVWGVATFYNQFRFSAPGRFHVQVCRGTACHVKGSAGVLEAVERELGIQEGQTTRDGLFSLEVVACIGACGLAPVIKVNETFHGGVTRDALHEILEACRKEGSHA